MTGLEKLTQLTRLNFTTNKLTFVTGLENLTQLTHLYLENNPDLTKAQIDELRKALPKCIILSNRWSKAGADWPTTSLAGPCWARS